MRTAVPTAAIAAALAAEAPVTCTGGNAPALAGLSLGEAVLALSPFHAGGYVMGASLAADGAWIRATYRQNGTKRTANKATGKAKNAAARLTNASAHPLSAAASEHCASLGFPFGVRAPRNVRGQ